MARVDGLPKSSGGQDSHEEDVGEEGEVGEHQEGVEFHLAWFLLDWIYPNLGHLLKLDCDSWWIIPKDEERPKRIHQIVGLMLMGIYVKQYPIPSVRSRWGSDRYL